MYYIRTYTKNHKIEKWLVDDDYRVITIRIAVTILSKKLAETTCLLSRKLTAFFTDVIYSKIEEK